MSSPNAKLSIHLDAIAANWQAFRREAPSADCGAVVKADAYGLGVAKVAPALYRTGCRHFFVASLAEAIELKALLPVDVAIFIMTGLYSGEERECAARGFVPFLLSMEMWARWESSVLPGAPYALKVDTGMGRLGMSPDEVLSLHQSSRLAQQPGFSYLVSHMACADEPDHPLNRLQLERFRSLAELLREDFPELRLSLANSSTCALGNDYQFQLCRPGIGLYGGLRSVGASTLAPVLTLALPVIQLKWVDAGTPIGYGATFTCARRSCIATVAGGYADGVMRIGSNRIQGLYNEVLVPQVGRVSMDSMMFDVTDAVSAEASDGAAGELVLLSEAYGVAELGEACGTISYEILTALGTRYARVYTGEALNDA